MLGYRCCSDLDNIPECEFESLLAGRNDRVFDAYVNIGSLVPQIRVLTQRYPSAKYIVVEDVAKSAERNNGGILDALEGTDVLHLHREHTNSWRSLCEHLRLAPPDAQYPTVREIGLRRHQRVPSDRKTVVSARWLRHDPSPWIAKPHAGWARSQRECFRGAGIVRFLTGVLRGRSRSNPVRAVAATKRYLPWKPRSFPSG